MAEDELRKGVHLEWYTDNGDGDKIKYLITHWGHPPEDLDVMQQAKWMIDRGPQMFAIRKADIIQIIQDAHRIPGLEDIWAQDGDLNE